MGHIFNLDWAKLFEQSTPILEIFIRGTCMYLGLFALLRIVLKRESGAIGITDLLVVTLLADAAQNALADDYHSIPDGILLVSTIILWAHLLNWLGSRFPILQRFVHPPPLMLVKEGKMLWSNMRRELISEDELMSQLRQSGIEDLKEVKFAYLEGDGRISVITYENKTDVSQKQERVV